MASLRSVFDARMFDGDNASCWNEAQDCVLRGFQATGEWVALTLGEDAAVDVMQAVADALTERQAEGRFEAEDWREHWIETEQLKISPSFFDDLRSLSVFAEEGIYRPCDFAERTDLSPEQLVQLEAGRDVGDWVRQCAAVISEFMRLAPEPAGGRTVIYDALYRVRDKALARLNFDEGAPLSAQEVADLSGVSLKRVQNAAYEKGGAGPVMNKQGRFERESVVEWLARKGFRFSIWQQIAQLGKLGPGWGEAEEVDPALLVNDDLGEEVEEAEADYVFVPAASDRTRFLPNVRREAGYQIGPKGSEVYETDYFRALEALARQSTPRWRRPNEAGNWGIVSGVTWERVLRADLERAATQI